MRHIANALQQGGYEVIVISPKGENQDRKSFEVINGIKVYRYPPCHANAGWAYLVEYPWAFLCTVLLSLLVWIRHGIDIIHSANPPDMFFLFAWPLKLLGKKFVFDEHDLCPELYEAKFHRRDWIYRLLVCLQSVSYRTADLVIATNQSYHDIARARGCLPEGRVVVVRNGVDMNYFHVRPERPELKEGFAYMALYLGVMGRQDGVAGVFHAARELVHSHGRRDVLFVMVGKGECLPELKELARQLQVAEFVHFTGRISDDLLIDYLSTADVCLAPDPPNAMNHLSTMTKILEYMAFGRPIVSFNLLESQRSAGQAAIYIEDDDPKAFAKALHDLLNDPGRRKQMGEVGFERSRDLIGWHRSRQALLNAYLRLSNGNSFDQQLTSIPADSKGHASAQGQQF
jgi:glycosyltransferase involved in cell wall biosynthesis